MTRRTLKRGAIVIAPVAFVGSLFAAPWALTAWLGAIVLSFLLLFGALGAKELLR